MTLLEPRGVVLEEGSFRAAEGQRELVELNLLLERAGPRVRAMLQQWVSTAPLFRQIRWSQQAQRQLIRWVLTGRASAGTPGRTE